MLGETRVAVNGIALHVIEAGPKEGPLVILLHGFPEFSYGWRHQLGALTAAGHRVVVPDQRGYGRSDKPSGIEPYRLSALRDDVLALASSYGRDRFRLVGHDWGGIVAWAVAAAAPERVEKLVVLNAPHPDTRWAQMRRDPLQLLRSAYVAFFQIGGGVPERMLAAGDFWALKTALRRSSWPGTFRPDDLLLYRDAWAMPGALAGMLGWYRALIRHPPDPIGRVRVPTRVIWGMRDTALGPGFAEASLAFCDDGRLIPYDDATHWVLHEEPKAVAADLVAFLA